MKTILAYDTETTGLPLFSQPSSHPDQPRVTQIAAKLIEEETRTVLGSMDVLIQPDGWTIPDEVQKLTGITMERAHKFGVPIERALHLFMDLWGGADERVAHNESFDMRMLRIEIVRHPYFSMQAINDVPFADYWKAAQAYCTATNSTSILNLPPTPKMVAARRNHPKTPNLGEAYEYFTGKKLVGAHNAMVDVDACIEVYYGIQNHTIPF
jgi:DNA polymerase-3 subunit epsilon